jgi:chromosome segregation ATPase
MDTNPQGTPDRTPDAPTAAAPGPATTPLGGTDILGALAGFEAQLTAIRRAHEEHARQTAALAQRERALAERLAQLDARAAQLAASEASFAARDDELALLAETIEKRHRDLERLAAAQAEREKDHTARVDDIETRRAALTDQRAAIERLALELAQQRTDLDDRLHSLIEREEALRAVRTSERSAAQRCEELEARLAQQSKASEDAAARIRSLHAELAGAHEALMRQGGAAEQLGELRTENKRLKGEVDALRERAATQGESAALDAAKAELATLRAALEEARQRFVADASEAASKLEALETRCAALDREIAESGRVRDEALAKALSLAQHADEAERTISSLRAQLADAAPHSAKPSGTVIDAAELENLRARVIAAESRANELEEAASRAAEEAAALRASAADHEAVSQREALLRQKLDEAAELVRTTRDELAQAKARAEESNEAHAEKLRTAAAALETELSKRRESDRAADRLGVDLAAAEARAARAEQALASRPPNRDQVFLAERRRRLRSVRASLGHRRRKLEIASEAVAERYKQCETVLARRAELSQAYDAFVHMRQKATRVQSRINALAAAGVAAIAGVALAGASWLVAGRVAPMTYVASAAISADTTKRELSEQELASWQEYHEKLVGDASLLEAAAERFKRRGMASLGEPGALAAYTRLNLSTQSTGPGQLTLELRAGRPTQAQRELDTFVIALINTANQARARRSDGAPTVLSQEITTQTTPIADQRPIYAGAIFGGSMLVFGSFGAILSQRFGSTRRRAVRDRSIEEALSEVRWSGGAR